MKKILFKKILSDCLVFFVIALLFAALVIWIFQAVNHLDIMIEDGRDHLTYIKFTLLILAFTALIATIGHITMTQAIKAAPMVVTQPILFLQLVWASMVGLFLFDEQFDLYVIIGGTIIMICVCYVSYREHVLGKKITNDVLQKVI